MTGTYDVVINGGGPVGMGLAVELGQRGVRTAVVERYLEPQPIPKGQNLTQRTTEHFFFWGSGDRLRLAHPLPEGAGIGGITCYGTLISDYHYDWLNRAKVGEYYFTKNARLPQYATERVLRERAAEIPAIETFFGWAGEALEQDAQGVSLTIGEHDGTGKKMLRAQYLVGADGSRSFVRESADITQTMSDHDRLMALVVFTSEELHGLLERYPGKAFYCVLHPEYQGYWLFFGRVDHGKSWFFHAPVPLGTTRDNFDFRGLLHKAVGRRFDLSLDHIGLWELRVALADTYRADRIFIAGDAAHSHPPYGGYGVNTGLEDARNLGWKLAATLQGWGSEALLDSYEAERRPVFASTAKDFIERFINDDRAFLNSYSPEKDLLEFQQKWSTRNLDVAEVSAFEPNYAGSPICPSVNAYPSALGSHLFKARVGHHLAPFVLSDGRNVFETLGPGFTLLLFGDPGHGNDLRDAAQSKGIPMTIVSDNSLSGSDYYGNSCVMVRPDQFVAWAGELDDSKDILSNALALNVTHKI